MANYHDKHRSRMRNRFAQFGFEGMEEHEVLEMLLYSAHTRKNTNEIAHALIAKFGSLSQVLDASPEELMSVPGVGEVSAFTIKFCVEVGRHYFLSDIKKKRFATLAETSQYVIKLLFGKKFEEFHMLLLDFNFKFIACVKISEGTADRVPIDVKKIVATALKFDAANIVLAHNHPSGSPQPSVDDINLTIKIVSAFKELGIDVCDHIITAGGNDFYSFNKERLFRNSVEDDIASLEAAQYVDTSPD